MSPRPRTDTPLRHILRAQPRPGRREPPGWYPQPWRVGRNGLRAGAGGARRTAGLEAPFVGRDRELQTVIAAAESSASDRRAVQLSVLGEAGAGKSRLVWEFFKYVDGIEEVSYWHQGRCLSYGEGVAYWALAEMVRSRARIEEEDEPAGARAKLHELVDSIACSCLFLHFYCTRDCPGRLLQWQFNRY